MLVYEHVQRLSSELKSKQIFTCCSVAAVNEKGLKITSHLQNTPTKFLISLGIFGLRKLVYNNAFSIVA